MTTQSKAQQRADQIELFRKELQILKNDGIIHLGEEQSDSLARYHTSILAALTEKYDVDIDRREKQLSLGMRVASFLGALAFGASLFFLFYQFWGYLSVFVQVIILICTPLVFILATAFAATREKTGYYTKILGMLSLAAFILNIVMLGTVFNMAGSYTVFLVWAALGLLLAYGADARLLLAAGILAFAGFLSAQTGTWSGCYWIHFGERPENFFPAAVILILLGLLPQKNHFLFSSIYRVFGLLGLFIPILILANWGYISYIPLPSSFVEVVYQILAFLFSAFFIWLGIKRGWPDMVNTANVFFVLFLYTKFFDWWWDVMPKYLFFLIIGLCSLLLLVAFKRLRSREAVPGGAI